MTKVVYGKCLVGAVAQLLNDVWVLGFESVRTPDNKGYVKLEFKFVGS